jgi:hypothetical protein
MSEPPAPQVEASLGATIRPARPDDISAVGDLLSLRDHRRWDHESTSWFLHGLDPARCLAWLAFVGDKPVAVSTMFVRSLRGPAGELRVGYWANLFIDPAQRHQMLYPRLPFAMFEAARKTGLRFVYGSVRLPELTAAHLRIGFGRVGTIPVSMKALRPARLVAKYKGWTWLSGTASVADAPYHGYLGLRWRGLGSDAVAVELDGSGPDGASLVEKLAAAAEHRLCDSWTRASLRYRYRQTREGTGYQALGIRRGGDLVCAVIYRIAERGAGIHAGVIMDVMCSPGEERAAISCLVEVERRAHRAGCELMLFLDGLGPEASALFTASGYRHAPEKYDLLVWPKARLTEDPWLANIENWRFAFGDHDAF